MKTLVVLLTLTSLVLGCSKQGPYDESADAKADIRQTLANAKINNKPTVIIFGANWCSNCQALAKNLASGADASAIANEFELVKVNIGNFDTNLDVANSYGNPISGGIPGAALLSANEKLVYVTKPGELTGIRNKNESLYQFFKKHLP